MRKLADKLRHTCGETLTETLAAVLLCGVAAALLMSSILTAYGFNLDARMTMKQMELQGGYAAREASYLKDGEPIEFSTGTVTVVDWDAPSHSQTFNGTTKVKVKVFGGPLIVSYDLVEGA